MPYYAHDPYGPPGFSAARYSALLYLGGLSGRSCPRPLPSRPVVPRRYSPLPTICESPPRALPPRSSALPSRPSALSSRPSALTPRAIARYTTPRCYDTADLDVTSPRPGYSPSSGPPAAPLQRGRAVVRLHTRVLKERPAAAVGATRRTPGERLMEKFMLPDVSTASPPKGTDGRGGGERLDGQGGGERLDSRGGGERPSGQSESGAERPSGQSECGVERPSGQSECGLERPSGQVDGEGERLDGRGEGERPSGQDGGVEGPRSGDGVIAVPRLVLSEVHVEVSEVVRRARRLVQFEVVVESSAVERQQEPQPSLQTAELPAGAEDAGRKAAGGPDGAAGDRRVGKGAGGPRPPNTKVEPRGAAERGKPTPKPPGQPPESPRREDLLEASSKPTANDYGSTEKTAGEASAKKEAEVKSKLAEKRMEILAVHETVSPKSKLQAKLPKDKLEKSSESPSPVKTRQMPPSLGTNASAPVEHSNKKPKEPLATCDTAKPVSTGVHIANKIIPIELGQPHDSENIPCKTAINSSQPKPLQSNISPQSPKSIKPSTNMEPQASKSSTDTSISLSIQKQNKISTLEEKGEKTESMSAMKVVKMDVPQKKEETKAKTQLLASKPGALVIPKSTGDLPSSESMPPSTQQKKAKMIQKPPPLNLKNIDADLKITEKGWDMTSPPDSATKLLKKAIRIDSNLPVKDNGMDSHYEASTPASVTNKSEKHFQWGVKDAFKEDKVTGTQAKPSTPDSPKRILEKQPSADSTSKSCLDLGVQSPKITSRGEDLKKLNNKTQGNLATTEAEKKAPDKAPKHASASDSPKKTPDKSTWKNLERSFVENSAISEVSSTKEEIHSPIDSISTQLESKTPEKILEKPLIPDSPKKKLGKSNALPSIPILLSKEKTTELMESRSPDKTEPKRQENLPSLAKARADKKPFENEQEKPSSPVSPKKTKEISIISTSDSSSPTKDTTDGVNVAVSPRGVGPKKIEKPLQLDRKNLAEDGKVLEQEQKIESTSNLSKVAVKENMSTVSTPSPNAVAVSSPSAEPPAEISPKKPEKPPPLKLKSAADDKKAPSKAQEKQGKPDSPKNLPGKAFSPTAKESVMPATVMASTEVPESPIKKSPPQSQGKAVKKKVPAKTEAKPSAPDSPKGKCASDAPSAVTSTATSKSTAPVSTPEAASDSLPKSKSKIPTSELVSPNADGGAGGKKTNALEQKPLEKSKAAKPSEDHQNTRQPEKKESSKLAAGKKQPPRRKQSGEKALTDEIAGTKSRDELTKTGDGSVLLGPTKNACKDKGSPGGAKAAAGEGGVWGRSESTSSGSVSLEDTSSEEETSSEEDETSSEEESEEDDPEVLMIREAIKMASIPGTSATPATSLPRFRDYCVQDFFFLKVLGKGSFGKVFLAVMKDTDRHYAIKCLKKQSVIEEEDVECTLIERKVLLLATPHPYLCHLFCTFQTESHLFFVMEYLNGGDLMFHIQRTGRFEQDRARFYAAEVVSGLKFLHKKGIVYRDLKLDNLLLDFHGHVRIADFGMCKLQIFLDRTADTFCGTPDYIAPEIIKGYRYNQTVDWWSFGVLLYEMLVGQSPFQGCDDEELFWCICNQPPVYPRFLTHEAREILSKFLTQDSDRRLGSSCSPHGDVCDQDFFRPIDWWRLERRQLEPPFKPVLTHPLDLKYFDTTFTCERAKLTPVEKHCISAEDQLQFSDFSYTNPNATD